MASASAPTHGGGSSGRRTPRPPAPSPPRAQNTCGTCRGAVDTHLRKRIGRRRLDDVTRDDMARVVAELRPTGHSERPICTALMVAGQASRQPRRMGWHRASPTTPLERGEP